MKDSAWYNRLWQNKMQQLTLEEDGDAAWKNMLALLDENMPVTLPIANPSPPRPWWVKLITVLAVVTTIAVIYYAGSRLLAHHPKKTIKQTGKHAIINRDTTQNKSATTDEPLSANKQGNTITDAAITVSSNNKANDKQAGNNKQAPTNQPSTTGAKLLNSNAAAYLNKANSKQSGNNASGINVKTAGISHLSAGNSYMNQRNICRNLGNRKNVKAADVNHLSVGNSYTNQRNTSRNLSLGSGKKNNNRLLAANSGLYTVYAQNRRLHTNVSAGNTHTKTSNTYKTGSQNGGQNLEDANPHSSNSTSPTSAGSRNTSAPQKNTPPGLLAKTNNTNAPKTAAAIASATYSKSQNANAGIKVKTSNAGKGGNSDFDIGLRLGVNTNGGGPSAGISANYHISKKWGLVFGADVLATRQVSGSYSKDSLVYVTTNDTGKQIKHNSGKLIINGSRKIYTVDIPVMASYKPSDRITIMVGGIISIPLKTGANKNTLGALSSSADSTTVKEATPYVNSTTINNKLSLSLSAGVRYTVKRVFIDVGYVQGISPYTISSSLGSSKTNYHTVQFGIGYQLFKATSKK
jgi:hypothetical protein